MANELDNAFALLKAALTGGAPETSALDAQRWWQLFRLMQRNHVAALAADAMATLDVPREVKIPWLAERDKAARWYRYQLDVQKDITDRMERHGIETLVLKGTSIAKYYPQPELREFGDLDLYFYDRHDEADEVARKELGVAPDNGTHHHSKYDYRGITVESHYDFLNTYYPHSNSRYNRLLEELVGTQNQLPTFEVLYLLRHMAIHFAASRITLRDLADWALTCRALHNDVDWGTVGSVVTEYNMERFASALDDIADRHLGYASPLQLPHTDDTTDALMHDIVYGSDIHDRKRLQLHEALHQWRINHWKRRLAFGDSGASLILHKLGSHLHKAI